LIQKDGFMRGQIPSSEVAIPVGGHTLSGELVTVSNAVVLFAHGSGSSRHSPRNQYVARVLHEAGLGTLLFDLLTPGEEEAEYFTRHLRFNIELLAERLVLATQWLKTQDIGNPLRIGYFGSSTGGGAALVAAAKLGSQVGAVVSRGGRPDLAASYLPRVTAPTFLIVGGMDTPVIEMNEEAYRLLACDKELRLVPGASHLFEEEGALETVARLAAEWFQKKLQPESGGLT
jgi:putative phosphoribosyl transferase